ncbi:MAG: HNH endonuclease [Deltaproteobacteria bacterium]|nr:HNH endonuclease [Deltaproteobacteria bacterium]
MLVIVDGKTLKRGLHNYEFTGDPGEVFDGWDDYRSKHPALKQLKRGDRLFLATVLPLSEGERFLLVAVYKDLKRSREGVWVSSNPNATPITDISDLRAKIRFTNPNRRLSVEPGKLAKSLQTPGFLTPESVALLESAIKGGGGEATPALSSTLPTPPAKIGAVEGHTVYAEVARRERDTELKEECLRRDEHQCQHCGFGRDWVHSDIGRKVIVHVHHIHPLKDTDGAVETSIDDLLTLCPTCHGVIHAVADAQGIEKLDLKVLKRYYLLE